MFYFHVGRNVWQAYEKSWKCCADAAVNYIAKVEKGFILLNYSEYIRKTNLFVEDICVNLTIYTKRWTF